MLPHTTTGFCFYLPRDSYLRHYLNIVCLWSIYTQFDLMPESAKRWAPEDGVWMVWWMKWQIFTPLLLLQGLNLCELYLHSLSFIASQSNTFLLDFHDGDNIVWYFLILRIMYRALTGNVLADDRTDDEDDETPVGQKKTQ